MAKDLNIALQNAIGDLGTDVLKSPFLVNILQDYGAFDVCDKSEEQIKNLFVELERKGHIELITSWRNLSRKQINRRGKYLSKKYNDSVYVQYIINTIVGTLDMPIIPNWPLTTPSPKPVITRTPPKNDNTSKIVSKVFLIIGGIALIVLLIWLVSKIFIWIIAFFVVFSALLSAKR